MRKSSKQITNEYFKDLDGKNLNHYKDYIDRVHLAYLDSGKKVSQRIVLIVLIWIATIAYNNEFVQGGQFIGLQFSDLEFTLYLICVLTGLIIYLLYIAAYSVIASESVLDAYYKEILNDKDYRRIYLLTLFPAYSAVEDELGIDQKNSKNIYKLWNKLFHLLFSTFSVAIFIHITYISITTLSSNWLLYASVLIGSLFLIRGLLLWGQVINEHYKAR